MNGHYFVAVNNINFSLCATWQRYNSAAPVRSIRMYSKSQFYALEVMCRERAVIAAKELEYWLAEAEEWARVRTHGDEPLTSSPELAPSAKLEG